MNEQQLRPKKPRKILGNGSVTEFLNSSNSLNNNNSNLNPTSSQQVLVANSGKNSNINSPITTLSSITQQQQQQMERLRLANMINQEMHALWPYGPATFLSPMLPAPNMALPYALAGTLPYAAVPIYGGPQQCTLTPVSSTSNAVTPTNQALLHPQHPPQSQQQQTTIRSNLSNNSNPANNPNISNDSNKINIQIGLQCVSQNTPLNFNTMNDTLTKVNLLNFCGATSQTSDKDGKESSSSLRSSPILLSSDENSINVGNGAGGDATNSNSPASSSSSSSGTVTLSQAKFNELTRLALRGSEIAEKLAYIHRNRPCFKKIDSLCARMKQDLIRPDGVLPNINSQGIAWAVKDFIFVFTRVINAWIIIKGYVYNTPEGLNKVKAALSPDFPASFAAWQDTTMDFIENLIKSFVNLDNLVQSQKNAYQKSDGAATRNGNSTPIKLLQPVNSLLDDSFDFLNSSSEKSQQNSINKNYLYTMVEDSEGSQRQATVNGTYFKTGTYNPIKKETLLASQTPGSSNSSSPSPSGNRIPTPTSHLLATNSALEQYFDEQLSEFWTPTEIDATAAAVVTAATATTEYLKIKEKIPPNWLNYDLRVLEQNLTEFSNDFDPNGPPRQLSKDLIEKLNIMIERLMSMKNADLFFKFQFTQNYFPDFIAKHKSDFMDVRSIILKCQVGGYQHIYEVVYDVKKIIYSGKEFLKINNDVKLQKSITAFEAEFNKLLSEPPFENYHFEHITGEPKETLYNYRSK